MGESFNPSTGKLEASDVVSVEPQVSMLGPGGVSRSVPKSQAQFFADSGYQLDTPAARQEIALQKQYGEGLGNELGAAGLGAARSLSFGLSDLAFAHSGLVSSQALRELKERNPDATLAGELGAIVVPGIGSALSAVKGASLAASAARGAGALAEGAGSGLSLLSGLGEGVAKAATKATGSAILGRAASDAAQSLAFHIGSNLSEAVLGDKDITAERLLAHGGQALAIGAGLGLGVPLATKAVTAAAQKAKEAITGLGTILKTRVLPAASDAAAGAYSKAFGAATGGGEQAADEVFAMLEGGFKPAQAKEREALLRAISPDDRDALHREFHSLLDDAHRQTESAARQAFRDFRPKEIDKLLDGVEVQPALAEAGKLVDITRATAKRMADDPLLYDQTYRRELERVADGLEEKLTSSDIGSAADLFRSVNDIKGAALSDLSKFNKALGSRAQENAAKEVKGVYNAFKSHLEDSAVYGDAAARQEAFNDAFATYKRLVDKKGDFKRFFLGPGGEVDVGKVNTFLNRIGSGRDREMVGALNDFQAASSGLVEQVEKSALGVGVESIDRKGFESILGKIAEKQKKAAEDLAFTSKVRAQDAFGMALLNFQKNVGETLFKEGVFSATLKLAQRAANPFGVAKTLSAAEGLVLKGSERASEAIGRAVDGMVRAGGKAAAVARPYAEPASINVLLRTIIGDDGDKPKNRQDGYKKAVKRLADLTGDPGTTAEKFGEGVHHLSKAAPDLTQSTVDTQMRALQFVYDKAPKNPDTGMTLNPFIQEWQPSDGDLAKWERYTAAVADPLSVLDELRHGNVSPEAVEALQAVYPNLYEDVRTQLTQRVSQLQETVPYHDRLQLSLLFGVSLDPSLEAGFVNAIQNSYGQAAQAQDSRPAYRPSSAATKLGALEETPAQRIERR